MSLLKVVLVILALLLIGATAWFYAEGSKLTTFDESARTLAPGEHIELTDGHIHYRWDGPEEGPIIVMAHGFSTPLFVYEQNAQALAQAGFRVLRYDHFGRGWSDRPRVKYDIDFYDRALLELLDRLGITEPIGLVGLSMGGATTAEFTARHPDRVRKLFLLVPASFDTAGNDGLGPALIRMPVIGDWIWRMSWRSLLLGDGRYEAASQGTADNRLMGDVTQQMDYRGFGYALLSTLRHMPMVDREDTFQRLAATGVPVMALYGDKDETVLISSADKLRTAHPEAVIHVMEGGEHDLSVRRHSEVSPLLVDWFSDTEETAQ
ncbi:MAG: alpha/beta hydrolase [Henriciella sp.]|nr:alpha/beta hydrolase [Henriciella sp.]